MLEPRIIVALDFSQGEAALNFVEQLDPGSCRLKVGKELFTAEGPAFIEKIQKKGFEVFLDLKFHDIPNTVAQACKAAATLGVWMLNVHALGGPRMLDAAREALAGFKRRPKLIAVTLLTSMTVDDVVSLGITQPPQAFALRLAKLAKSCGLDGVVCSGLEANLVRNAIIGEFLLVTPGIRPLQANADDQVRTMTPLQAVKSGADYLVIGRPITQAANPLQKLQEINNELRNGGRE